VFLGNSPPKVDGGYDAYHQRGVVPALGSLYDAKALIGESHQTTDRLGVAIRVSPE
jgi:glycosidase